MFTIELKFSNWDHAETIETANDKQEAINKMAILFVKKVNECKRVTMKQPIKMLSSEVKMSFVAIFPNMFLAMRVTEQNNDLIGLTVDNDQASNLTRAFDQVHFENSKNV